MFTDAKRISRVSPDDIYRWASDLRGMCLAYVRQCHEGSDKPKLLKTPIRFETPTGYGLLAGYDPISGQFLVSHFYTEEGNSHLLATSQDLLHVSNIPLDAMLEFAQRIQFHHEDVKNDSVAYYLNPERVSAGDLVLVFEKPGKSYFGRVVAVHGFVVRVQVAADNKDRKDVGVINITTLAYLRGAAIL